MYPLGHSVSEISSIGTTICSLVDVAESVRFKVELLKVAGLLVDFLNAKENIINVSKKSLLPIF